MHRYLALGDSYTIGEGVDPAQRWPVRLAAALRDEGFDLAPPRIIATTGWTTDELSGAIAAEQPLGTFELVTLGIGVNDQYRGRSVAEYRAQLLALLENARALAAGDAGRVLMLSIPDWGMTPFARAEGRDAATVAREIDAFNDAARQLCDAQRIAFVDITADSRDGGGHEAMLVADGLHPTGAMYARWVALVLPVARRLLAPAG